MKLVEMKAVAGRRESLGWKQAYQMYPVLFHYLLL